LVKDGNSQGAIQYCNVGIKRIMKTHEKVLLEAGNELYLSEQIKDLKEKTIHLNNYHALMRRADKLKPAPGPTLGSTGGARPYIPEDIEVRKAV
jgi:hypothetical protein